MRHVVALHGCCTFCDSKRFKHLLIGQSDVSIYAANVKGLFQRYVLVCKDCQGWSLLDVTTRTNYSDFMTRIASKLYPYYFKYKEESP